MNSQMPGTNQNMTQGSFYQTELWSFDTFSEYIPIIFYKAIDLAHNFVIIMEDGKLKGKLYEQETQEIPLSEANRLVEYIAKFHTIQSKKDFPTLSTIFTFNYYTSRATPFASEKNWGIYNKENLAAMADTFEIGWADLGLLIKATNLENTPFTNVPQLYEDVSKIVNRKLFISSFEEMMSFPQTVIHGDLRTDNMIFFEKDIKLIDWQCCVKGCGLVDLARFLVLCLPPKMLLENEKNFLELYSKHTGLKNVDHMFKVCIWNEAFFCNILGKAFKPYLGMMKIETLGRSFTVTYMIIERTLAALKSHYSQ